MSTPAHPDNTDHGNTDHSAKDQPSEHPGADSAPGRTASTGAGSSSTEEVRREVPVAREQIVERVEAPRNGLGTAALVLGIIAILFGLVFPISILFGLLAIILGFLGRGRYKRREATNGGAAMAGIITGIVGLLIGVGVLVLSFTVLETFSECLGLPAGTEQEQCVENVLSDM